MTANYTTTLLVPQAPGDVFRAINNIRGWWSQDFSGNTDNVDDEFEVHFGEVHYSRQKLVEKVPGKRLVWEVTDSRLNFINDKNEWTGTTIIFELLPENNGTKILFTHKGLVPQLECFKDCSNGWAFYLHSSLTPLITTGQGKPNLLTA